MTDLGVASFAPYFFPDGKRIIFSSNYGDPQGREFDLWAIDTNGTNLERITWTGGFDGFPMFSPDGKWLAFASNRNQARPGETDIFVARWIPGSPVATVETPADRFYADAAFADDAREGRGIGSAGIAAGERGSSSASAASACSQRGRRGASASRSRWWSPSPRARGPRSRSTAPRRPPTTTARSPSRAPALSRGTWWRSATASSPPS